MYKAILSRTPSRHYKAEYWHGDELVDVHFWEHHCKAMDVLKQAGGRVRSRERFHIWPKEVGTEVEFKIENPQRWFWESRT